jgi:hypothetical protein
MFFFAYLRTSLITVTLRVSARGSARSRSTFLSLALTRFALEA